MIKYTTTNDYGKMPQDIREHIEEALAGQLGTFDMLLGGDVFVLEKLEELSEITVDYENGGTAADTVAPIDVAERFSQHTLLLLVTNDGGGPSYFIPNLLADHCIIVQSIIKATQGERLRLIEENA